MTTTTSAALADQYFALWNETDEARGADLLAATWTTDCSYVDPTFEAAGQTEVSELVAAAHQLFPGLRFALTGEVEQHHNRIRWSWELAADGQPAVAGGTDMVTLDADGKIREVVGFLDFAPAH